MHLRRHGAIASNDSRIVESSANVFLGGCSYRRLFQHFFIDNLISQAFLLQIEDLLQFHFFKYTFSLSLFLRVLYVAILDLSRYTLLRWLHLRVSCDPYRISLAVTVDKWHFRHFFRNHFLAWRLNVTVCIKCRQWVASLDVTAHTACIETSTPYRP